MSRELDVACSTIVFRDLDVFEALGHLAAAGFLAADIGVVPGFCPHIDLSACPPALIARIRDHLRALNLRLTSLNVHPGFLNTPNWSRASDRIRRALDLAAEWSCPVVTIPAGLADDDRLWPSTIGTIGERLCALADHAASRGAQLSIEMPHAGSLVETMDQVTRLMSEPAFDARIRCTFDTSHAARASNGEIAAAWRLMGPRINHVHLRDAVGTNGMVTPGRGTVDFVSLFERFHATSPRPTLALELEFRGASVQHRRDELRFARAYLQMAARSEGLPVRMRFERARPVRLLRRLRSNPIEELKRSPTVKRTARWIHTRVVSLRPIRAYDGFWRHRWYPPRRREPRVPARASVALQAHPDRPLAVCIVGCGNAGTLHAFGFSRLREVRVCGVSDVNRVRAREVATRVDCREYASSIEMVERESPDIVAICTPEWRHYDLARRALLDGRDVFCEKILTTRLDEARDLVRVAADAGRVLGVNYNYRFMRGVTALRRIVANGELGRLNLAHIKVHAFSYHHALDLVTFLFGRVGAVRAAYFNDDRLRPFGGTDWDLFDDDLLYVPSRNAAVIFELESGGVVTLGSSYLYDPWQFLLSIDVAFDRGAASLTGINILDFVGRLTTTHVGEAARHGKLAPGDGHGYEESFYQSIESFANAYVLKTAPETPGHVALFNIELERAIGESRRRGRVSL